MFEKEYKEFMEEVKPEEALVEKMIDRQHRTKRVVVMPKALKVAAVLLCVFLVLAGGTVAVDAATEGAVRRFFGLSDSVAVGVDEIEYVQREKKRGERGLTVGVVDKDGEVSVVVRSDKDIPVFFCYMGVEGNELSGANYHHLSVTVPLELYESKEDIAWMVYWHLRSIVNICGGGYLREGIIAELEKVQKEIGTGNEIKDGCTMGVQFVLDDLYANEGLNMELLRFQVPDTKDADGDGDTEEIRGYAYYKVDKDAWEKESAETGKMEFVVEAMGGIPGKYLVTVKGYEFSTLYYSATPLD